MAKSNSGQCIGKEKHWCTPWKTNITCLLKRDQISTGNTSSNHQFSRDMLVFGGFPMVISEPPQAPSFCCFLWGTVDFTVQSQRVCQLKNNAENSLASRKWMHWKKLPSFMAPDFGIYRLTDWFTFTGFLTSKLKIGSTKERKLEWNEAVSLIDPFWPPNLEGWHQRPFRSSMSNFARDESLLSQHHISTSYKQLHAACWFLCVFVFFVRTSTKRRAMRE